MVGFHSNGTDMDYIEGILKNILFALVFIFSAIGMFLLLMAMVQAADTNKVLVPNIPVDSISVAVNSGWTADTTGRIYTFWYAKAGTNYYLNYTYTDNNFATWTNGTVATNWNSWTSIGDIKAISTSNGSVIVGCWCNAPLAHNIAFFIHYYTLPVTTWVSKTAYSGSSAIVDWAMANSVAGDYILFAYYKSSAGGIDTRRYNVSTDTWTESWTNWWTSSYSGYGIRIITSPYDQKWYIAWGKHYGNNYYYRDYGKTISLYTYAASNYHDSTGWDFAILPNGIKLWVFPVSSGGTASSVILLTETAVNSNTFDSKYAWASIATADRYKWARFNVNLLNKIYITLYDQTDNTQEICGPFNYYDSGDIVRSSIRNLEDYGDDNHWCDYGSWQHYPKVSGVSFCMAYKGYLYTSIDKDSSTQYDFEIWHNGTNFTLPEITAPNITEDELPYWYIDEPYCFNISYSEDEGNPPFSFDVTYGSMPVGWFLMNDDGTIYGICPDTTGNYSVTITITDFIGNTDTAVLIIEIREREPTIIPGPSEGGEDETADLIWPDVDWMGDFWILLVFFSVFVALFKVIRDHAEQDKRG